MAPYSFTPHLESFTVPREPTPYVYDAVTRTCRMLLSFQDNLRIPITISFQGEPWKPRIKIAVYTEARARAEEAYRTMLQMTRAYMDYNEFIQAVGEWPELLQLAEKYPGLRPGRSLSLYEALIDSIIKQRIMLRTALRITARLVREYGVRVVVKELDYYSFPEPEKIVQAGIEEIRSLGLTRLKARALKEVAQAQVEGRIPDVREAEKEPWSVAEELTGIWGVGKWTAELAVAQVHPLFPIGPSSDLSVRRGFSIILGDYSEKLIEKVYKNTKEYAGLVMYLLALEYEKRKYPKK